MNTIVAISDTHLNNQCPTLPDDTINLIKNAQLVLHAGDIGTDLAYENLRQKCQEFCCILRAIQGSSPIIDESFGIKIGLIHDYNGENPSYDFSESDALEVAAGMQNAQKKITGVDLMVFGHIHEPIISWNKDKNGKRRLLVCPGYGAANGEYHKCPPTPTAAQINVDNGKIHSVKIISINI
jgi:putative phosphoesterase